MRYRLEVTTEDIANGKPSDPRSCPVALAAQRLLGVVFVSVEWSDAVRVNGRKYVLVSDGTDSNPNTFLFRFDAIGPGAVYPTTFILQDFESWWKESQDAG